LRDRRITIDDRYGLRQLSWDAIRELCDSCITTPQVRMDKASQSCDASPGLATHFCLPSLLANGAVVMATPATGVAGRLG
jgi:hypothetical protein